MLVGVINSSWVVGLMFGLSGAESTFSILFNLWVNTVRSAEVLALHTPWAIPFLFGTLSISELGLRRDVWLTETT